MGPFPLVISGIRQCQLLLNFLTGFLPLELLHKLKFVVGNDIQCQCWKEAEAGKSRKLSRIDCAGDPLSKGPVYFQLMEALWQEVTLLFILLAL